MVDTPNLTLPKLVQNQAAPHTDFNSAMYKLDSMVQMSVIDILSTPPTGVNGARYFVGGSATGDWTGKANSIAYYVVESSPDTIAEWRFLDPVEGMELFVQDDNEYYYYNGSQWISVHVGAFHGHIPLPYNGAASRDFILTFGLPYAIRITKFEVMIGIPPPVPPKPATLTAILVVNGTEDATSKIDKTLLDDYLLHRISGLTIDVVKDTLLELRAKAMSGTAQATDYRYSIEYHRYPD